MNKKIIAISILLILVSSKCFSQSGKIFIALDGGINKYLSNPNNYKTGFDIGWKAGYKVSNNFITGLKIDYQSNNPSDINTDEVTLTFLNGGQTIDLGIKTFFMFGNFNSQSVQNLYFLGGAGVDLIKFSGGETKEFGSFESSGYTTNLGLDFAIGMGFRIMDNASAYIQPELNASFSGISSLRTSLSVKSGVMYSF